MKKNLKKLLSLIVALCLCISLGSAALADGKKDGEKEEKPALHIRNAEELLRFAQGCRLDTYSENLTVVLDNDISLSGVNFEPIASFSGTFRGNGHAISDLELSGHMSRAGLFAIIQKGGTVSDLNVSGTVAMADSCEAAGGIAGENRGTVRGCSFSGTVSGSRCVGGIVGSNIALAEVSGCRSSGVVNGTTVTGGIVGLNEGTVASCENNAYVNTTGNDSAISVDDLPNLVTLDITLFGTKAIANYICDIGGIAGYSSGVIRASVNNAVVGYNHVGYNCGGIVGRSSGHLFACENTGKVFGRKDIGGVVGQMEPFVLTNLSESSIARIRSELESMKALVDRAASDVNDVGGELSEQFDTLNLLLDDAIGTYSGEPIGSFEDISENESLMETLSDISVQLSVINGVLADNSGALTEDVRQINNQFSSLSDVVITAVEALENPSPKITDTSVLDIDLVTLGKALKCRNDGEVTGDINVGGIAGAMALEYSLDPEDDSSAQVSDKYKSEYEAKAIIQECTNTASVSAKRNYAGGICGRMDLGLITDSCGFGPVSSETGDYVGGIAGITGASVRKSFAKCSLSGGKNVGGIVGNGVNQTVAGAVSKVTSCLSMVDIVRCEQCAGSVSGGSAGEFRENRFVSDDMPGIDGCSYTGQAEPVAFEELLADESVPAEMKTISVSFVAGDSVIESMTCSYGETVSPSLFPEVPQKDGLYGCWDRAELKNVRNDTVVTAVYSDFVTALASSVCRDDGRPVFYVQGSFGTGSTLSVVSQTQSVEDFAPLSDDIGGAGKALLRQCIRERRYIPAINLDVADQWVLTVPDDGSETHVLRYLPADKDGKHTDIYVMTKDGWHKTDSTVYGSYLEFVIAGNSIQLAAVETIPIAWLWLAAVGIILSVAAVIFIQIRAKHRIEKRRARRAASDAAARDSEDEDVSEETATGRVRKRPWLVPLAAAVLIILGTGITVLRYNTKLGNALVPYAMLRELSQRSELSMTVKADASLDGNTSSYTAQLKRCAMDSGFLTEVSSEGMTLYYCNNAVILENGKAYRLGGSVKDFSALLSTLTPVFKDTDIKVETSGDKKIYTASMGSQGVEEVLKMFLPGNDYASVASDEARVCMTCRGKEVEEISVTLSGAYGEGLKQKFSMSIVANDMGTERCEVPVKVMDTVRFASFDDLPVITDDLMRMVRAWTQMAGRECVSGDITLRAAGGPLVLNDTLQLYSWPVEGGRIHGFSKAGVTLYGNENGVVNARGKRISGAKDESGEQERLSELPKLVEAAYTLCIEGDVSCTETNGRFVYNVALNGDSIETLVKLIDPDIDPGIVTFSHGVLSVTVENDIISAMNISCTGTVDLIIAESSCTVSAAAEVVEGRVAELPEAVIKALSK